ncbi:hypothetical protein EV283_1033 [Sphingomonas sp. BK036]|nr:hypothetical protein EV283_1033 [Sphingomonas sp. BK036]
MIGRVRLRSPVSHATEIAVSRTDGTGDDDIAESTGFTREQVADLDPSDRAAILHEMGRKSALPKIAPTHAGITPASALKAAAAASVGNAPLTSPN